MRDEIIEGLVVAAVVGIFSRSRRRVPMAFRRGREKLARRRGMVVTGTVHLQLMDGLGQANLVHLMYEFPESSPQKTVPVEIEGPDAQQVWSINVPLGFKMSDL